MIKTLIRSALFFILCIGLMARADDCAREPDACVEVGSWQVSVAIGVGTRTNPLINNDDIPLIVLPQVSYSGERFFLQNLDMGVIVHEDDNQQFNLLITPSYDQVFFHRWDVNNFVLSENLSGSGSGAGPAVDNKDAFHRLIDTNQLRERRMGGLGGFEYSRQIDRMDLQIHALHELTGYHHGQELRISVAQHFLHGKHHWILSGGAIWQSAKVLNYYYGIEEGEGGTQDYRYDPGSGVSGVVRLDWNYRVTQHWGLTFTTAYRHLASGIRQSPIVKDDKVITAFFGGVYHF